ncbi:T9SS type A sorting domain-containing protein [Pseudopedobacter beijingensis]|uniref:T9SS type A sorting domain-containing protein n=1 Tax=Pseudopedobacter beijingensis TaxID=1207056 RepID=A0ABW4IB79_9SPHI
MKKLLPKKLLFFTIIYALCSLGARAQIYVDASRSDDTGNGDTPGTAKKTIQAAVDIASPNTSIIIAKGTYNENIIINKNGISLIGAGSGANGNAVPGMFDPANHTIISGGGNIGVSIQGAVTSISIKDLVITGFVKYGVQFLTSGTKDITISGVQFQNNGSTDTDAGIYINGGTENVSITNCSFVGNKPRSITIWNGFKKGIILENNYIEMSNAGALVGIDLQNGTASGVKVRNNTIIGTDYGDSAIGLIGLKSGAGANVISNNTINIAKRFGIEVKNPAGTGEDDENSDGAIIVSNNNITRSGNLGPEARDLAGIAVFRRSILPNNTDENIDVPSGVVIKGNNINGFVQTNGGATEEGFGIVAEGVRITIKNNKVSDCDVAIQRQGGNPSNYYKNGIGQADANAGEANQSATDNYFNRGNSPFSSAIVIAENTTNDGFTPITFREQFPIAGTYLNDYQYVFNTNLRTNYASIGLAVEAAEAGNTLQLSENTFDELVTINKPLTIDGLDNTKAKVTYTGPAITTNGNGIPTIFTVKAKNVTIKNISFTVNLDKLHSAIHSYDDVSGINIINNNFIAAATGLLVSGKLGYTRRNAIGINIDPYNNEIDYKNISAGITDITIQHNTVQGFIDGDISKGGFRGGFQVDRAKNVLIEDNTAQTINHDIICRFFTDGDVTVKNNKLNGGGLEMSSTNSTSGTVTIENNQFDGSASNGYTSQARFQTNTNNKTFILKNNQFTNTKWGVSLENFRNITIDNNEFTPSEDNFRLITVNTKMLLSIDNGQILPMDLYIKSNTFNGLNTATNGKAIAFYNHKYDAANNYLNSNIILGEPQAKNIFSNNIPTYIYIDNNNGSLTKDGSNVGMTGYPEYGDNIAVTTTGYWTKNIRADQNEFYVDGQLRVPFEMTASQRTELDGKIFDKKDDANIGEVQYYLPVKNITTDLNYATIQDAIDAAVDGEEIKALPGTYAEKITVNKRLTIKGPNAGIEGKGSRSAEAKIVPNATDLGVNSTAIVSFTAGAENSTFDGFEINGDNSTITNNIFPITSGGVNIDAAYGLSITDVGSIVIKNNIIQNFGSSESTPSAYLIGAKTTTLPLSGILITNNLLKNLNQSTAFASMDAISLENDVYAQIIANKFTDVRGAIQFVNAYRPNPLMGTFDAKIADNDITSYRLGLYYNLQYQNASPWLVQNNTFTSSTPIGGNTRYEAIRVESIQNKVNGNIIGNTINAGRIDRESEDNTFSTYGISFFNNVNTTGTFLVKDNDITNAKFGVAYGINDNTTSLTSNIRFIGGNIHNVTNYIAYETSEITPLFADIDLPSTQLDSKTGEEHYDLNGNLNAIYAKIIDKDDNPSLGKVNLIFPIKNTTQATAFTTVQKAIDDILTVDADAISIKNDPTVYESLGNVNISKGLSFEVSNNTNAVLKFNDFTTNAPGKEITFNNPVDIAGAFTLTAGKITPSSTGLTLNGSLNTVSGIGNFVNGKVTVNNVSSDILLPVGKNDKAAYIELVGASGTTSSFTTEYAAISYSDLTENDDDLESVSGKEYWKLDRNSGNINAKVRLYSFDLTASGLNTATWSDIVVAHVNPTLTTWESLKNDADINSVSKYVTTEAAISEYGYFTFGAITRVLPVQIVFFTAKADHAGAVLNWTTSSETANQKFIIEKSLNGQSFFKLTEVPAKGAGNYTFTDATFANAAYYRLSQVDANGKTTVYDNLIKFVSVNNPMITLYPNPTTSYVTVSLPQHANVQVNVTNAVGQQILSKTISDTNSLTVDLSKEKPGVYFIRLNTQEGITYHKVIKQ